MIGFNPNKLYRATTAIRRMTESAGESGLRQQERQQIYLSGGMRAVQDRSASRRRLKNLCAPDFDSANFWTAL
jgi:hypothetical protein